MMFNQYPYINVNDLNLDYILAQIKTMMNEVTNFVSINAIKYADPIQWDITRQYEKNTVVIDPVTGTAYISVAPVPAGVALTRPEYWTVVFDLGSFVTRAAQNFTSRYEQETTLTATFPTNTGEWLVWGDVLYKAKTNITAGDTYVVDGNIEHFTIEDLYNAYLNTIANILAMVGNLVDLNTADKSSIVNAINEVVANLAQEIIDRTNADAAIITRIDNMKIYNVVDYGATGDGVTDDTNAIKDAISAAENADGGIVYFPDGNYLITDTLICAGITLRGASIFDNNGVISRGSIITIKSMINAIRIDSDVTIEGLAFDYPDMDYSGADPIAYPATIRLYGSVSLFRMHDCAFYSCYDAISDKDKYGYGQGRFDITNIYAYAVHTFMELDDIHDVVYLNHIMLSWAYGSPVGNTARQTIAQNLSVWTGTKGVALKFTTHMDGLHLVDSFIFKYQYAIMFYDCAANLVNINSNLIDGTACHFASLHSSGGTNHIYNTNIVNNTFLGHNTTPPEASVVIHNSDTANNPNVLIANNTFEVLDKNGIVIENAIHTNVTGNIMRSVAENAIYIVGVGSGDFANVENNIIIGVNNTTSNGINCTVENANIIGNTIKMVNYPLYFSGMRSIVCENVIRDNANAMVVNASTEKKIYNNVASVFGTYPNTLHFDFGTIADGATATANATLLGVKNGSPVIFTDETAVSQYGVVVEFRIAGSNTVVGYARNMSGASITLTDVVVYAHVL